MFDALSCGALVITNGVLGSEEVFDGKLPIYTSREELTDILKFYLENEDERLRNLLLNEVVDILDAEHGAGLRKKYIAKERDAFKRKKA